MQAINISNIQIILLVVFAAIAILDQLTTLLCLDKPIFVGLFVGLIMGDLRTGLIVGGAVQLMSSGLITAGGTTIPDYICGTTLGIVIASVSGQGPEFGIAMAAALSAIFAYFDIVARYTNVFFQRKAEKYWENDDFEGVERMNIMGAIPWGLSRALPLLIVLVILKTAGVDTVQFAIAQIPKWLMSGLKVSGQILPVVGIAVLLRILNTKEFIPFLLIGFGLAAYLNIPMLGVALFGLSMSLIMFKSRTRLVPAVNGGDDEDE
ncbi:PTS system, mannose-specific IIC component [Clostridium amylolyticum]|uniref:PTS system, mannose-specific IIC component n=1 Tax=Clostridium amylolyticum TaxID=1121298 RepID=A0A1M6NTC2_9CLOT|nr:PTS sugar transporter subunit IIC [Clostridium amylolyticum]SHJ98878.1 PTS system, mannose-specific IIC component [Clostridium amylolyticum]